MAKTQEVEKIYFKFKTPLGISIPGGGTMTPPLHPSTKRVAGFQQPIAVQEYHFDDQEPTADNPFGHKADLHEVKLLPESPNEIPAGMKDSHDDVKRAFQVGQANALAANVLANTQTRAALRQYEEDGTIEILDSAKVEREKDKSVNKNADWRRQDGNDDKRLEEDSQDVKTELERREKDPQPFGQLNVAASGDANTKAQAEQNAAGGPDTKDEHPSEEARTGKKSK